MRFIQSLREIQYILNKIVKSPKVSAEVKKLLKIITKTIKLKDKYYALSNNYKYKKKIIKTIINN